MDKNERVKKNEWFEDWFNSEYYHLLYQNRSQNEADLFIKPGYQFKVIDGLITNFHLPKSTLLLLVSSLVGREKILNLYDIAIKNNYRFYSYGDSMFIKI